MQLIAIVLLLYFASCSIACTCHLKHPQEHVCEADFVLKVRVRKPRTTADGLTAYKIRIKKVFKASTKVKRALAKKFIYTIPGQCDIALKTKTTYVLAGDVEGGKPWISACSFSRPWKLLTPKMKKGFKLLYQTGCGCRILSCHWWDKCPPGNFFCPWVTSADKVDCQGEHGVCLRRPNGTCDWFGGRLYRSCMKTRSKTRGESWNDIMVSYQGLYRFHDSRRKYSDPKKQPHKGFRLHKSLYETIKNET